MAGFNTQLTFQIDASTFGDEPDGDGDSPVFVAGDGTQGEEERLLANMAKSLSVMQQLQKTGNEDMVDALERLVRVTLSNRDGSKRRTLPGGPDNENVAGTVSRRVAEPFLRFIRDAVLAASRGSRGRIIGRTFGESAEFLRRRRTRLQGVFNTAPGPRGGGMLGRAALSLGTKLAPAISTVAAGLAIVVGVVVGLVVAFVTLTATIMSLGYAITQTIRSFQRLVGGFSPELNTAKAFTSVVETLSKQRNAIIAGGSFARGEVAAARFMAAMSESLTRIAVVIVDFLVPILDMFSAFLENMNAWLAGDSDRENRAAVLNDMISNINKIAKEVTETQFALSNGRDPLMNQLLGIENPTSIPKTDSGGSSKPPELGGKGLFGGGKFLGGM